MEGEGQEKKGRQDVAEEGWEKVSLFWWSEDGLDRTVKGMMKSGPVRYNLKRNITRKKKT